MKRAIAVVMTPKEAAFVRAYLGPARGNATKAAKLAGYSKKTAYVTGSRMFKKVRVQVAIAARTAAQEKRAIANADEIDARMTYIMRTSTKGMVAISAAHELNKCHGRHSVNHKLIGRLTLEQVLTDSRSEDPPGA